MEQYHPIRCALLLVMVQCVFSKVNGMNTWFTTYGPAHEIFFNIEQRKLRRVCANAQTRLSLCCFVTQSIDVGEDSYLNLDIWPRGYKTFFMLNTIELENCHAH